MKWEELTPVQQEYFMTFLNKENTFEDGGWLTGIWNKIKSVLGMEEQKPKPPTYRGRLATVVNGQTMPKRIQRNNSPTQVASERFENRMRSQVVKHQNTSGGSNPSYDIPFIPDKAIIINGSTTSTNALDSLAKYAGIHNRNPKLSEKPLLRRDKYKAPRQINMNEMLGLSTQETRNGAWPYYNMNGDTAHDRALGNSNYITAFGAIPDR